MFELGRYSCDIYTLGAVMYRILAGRPVFEQNSIEAILHEVLTNTPLPPSRYRSGNPFALERLILQCLEKDPNARPQEVEEVRVTLNNISSGPLSDLRLLIAATRGQEQKVQRSAEATTAHLVSPKISPPLDSPGEFTSLFQKPSVAPQASHPPLASVPGANEPGEFTKMFGIRRPEAPRRIAAGEFTMLRLASEGRRLQGELTITEGPTRKNEHFNITNTRLTIGRETENGVVLSDESVSRFHAEILQDQEGFWIENKGSADGTSRNGTPIKGQETLEDGDQI